jgi:hypothetical protein
LILHSGTANIPDSELKTIDAFVAKGDGVARLLEEVSELAQSSVPRLASCTAPEALPVW